MGWMLCSHTDLAYVDLLWLLLMCHAPWHQHRRDIDNEALDIIFGLKKFHQYWYGHKFIIYTKRKALSYLFDPTQAIPQLVSSHVGIDISPYNSEYR